jgi:isopenicillin N synthase-like dioxygenase
MQLRLPLVNVERDVSGASLYEALQGVGFAYIVADETVYTEAFQSVLDAAREFFHFSCNDWAQRLSDMAAVPLLRCFAGRMHS